MVMSRPFLPPALRLLIREDSAPSPQNTRARKHPQVWNWLCRQFYPRANRVICVGDYVLNDLADNFGIPRSRMVRVDNPVDIDLARRLAEESRSPYSGEGPHLVAAGRLSREKGFDVLLDAMPLVSSVFPHVDVTILGDGPLKADLLAHRERLGLGGAVHLTGFKTNPYPYFKRADLLVLPSLFESFGLVLIEALAVGTPVVASDCPGAVREIIGGCPMARLVPPSDPKALADAIVSSLSSQVWRLDANQSLDVFLSRFDVKNVIREYENILET
jgi:glycosyltransferase involved in cell wall biosynthesis